MGSTTVYPTLMTAASLGDVKTTELNCGLAVVTHLLADAALEMAPRFSPAEWRALRGLEGQAMIEPEMPNPAALLADLAEQTSRFAAEPAAAAGAAAADGTTFTQRLRALTYLQTWAVLVAVRFSLVHAAGLEPDARWWELSVRRSLFCDTEPGSSAAA